MAARRETPSVSRGLTGRVTQAKRAAMGLPMFPYGGPPVRRQSTKRHHRPLDVRIDVAELAQEGFHCSLVLVAKKRT